MAVPAARTAKRPSLEHIERRLATLVGRAATRAERNAADMRAQAQQIATQSYYGREILDLQSAIRTYPKRTGELDPIERDQLSRMQQEAAHLRALLAQRTAPYEREAEADEGALVKARRLARSAEHLETARDRVERLLQAVDLLAGHLHAEERDVVAGLRAAAAELPAETPATEPAQTAVQLTAPEPTQWSFNPAPETALEARLADGPASLTAYELNRAAQELSLVRGFDVLLTPQLAHGLVQYPHQIETARVVLRRMRGRALLCDEVGLGKTIEAGIIAGEYFARGLARRILVLTPPALVGQWRQEMEEKFGLAFVTHEDADFRRLGPSAWGRFDHILASISTARLPAHRAALAEQEFDLIVVDEAHHLRSRSSLAWKLVNELKKRYVLLLTATPVQNDLDELFNLITLLSPGQLKTSAAFKREFTTRGDPRTPRNRERLRQLLSEVMVRNTRGQVHIAMPPRLATTRRVSQSAEEAALYAAITEHARQGVADGTLDRMTAATLLREAGSSAPAAARTLETLAHRRAGERKAFGELAAAARAVSHHAKVTEAVELLARRQQKTVVFTFFRETLRLLESALAEAHIAYATLSGDMPAAEKDRAQEAFAADRKVLLSTDVGSEGRNLQFCHSLLNFDLPWNPMRIEQRVGRVHRIGQRHEVVIDNLCARRTIEDYLLRVLDEKLNMFELVVGEIGVILGNLEADQDFEEMALDIWTSARSEEDLTRGFDELTEKLRGARERYREAQQMDEALFGEELAAPAEQEPAT